MKKSIVAIIIGIIGCLLITGCNSKKDDAGLPDKLEDTKETAQKNEADKDKERSKKADGGEKGSSEHDFAKAFKKGLVDNNGSYFVTIGNKVYFRLIPPDSMEEGATFGEFIRNEWTPARCSLICYDLDTCEWEEVGKINGIGKLYACPEGFYIGSMNPNSLDTYGVDLYDPGTGESDFYCKGIPLGVSDSGNLLAVERFEGDGMVTSLIKGGEEIVSLSEGDTYFEYCGFAGEDLITMVHTQDDKYKLCSVNEDGKITDFGIIGGSEDGYPEIKQFVISNGDVYINIGYFEGTGHFLSNWETIKAVPGKEGSLEKITKGRDAYEEERDEEGPENEVPMICFESTGDIFYSPHTPYKAYMGDGNGKRNDLCYLNDIYDECTLVKNFIRNDYGDSCQIVQDITSSYDTVFVIYADAVQDSEYDVGWRTGYKMTGWHTCAIPYGNDHVDENGLAKDIIYFDEPGTGMANEPARDISDNVSDSERENIEKKLNSIGYYGFLQSIYDDPRSIYWENVFYVGAGFDQGNPSEKIKKAYLKKTGEDEIYTDLTTISGKDVRAYVKKTTGYDFSDMKNPLDDWVYLEDYDLYLFQHGDTNQTQVTLSAVHYEDGEYTVTYDYVDGEERCLTFVDEGGNYRIISNQPKWFVLDPTNGGDIDQSMITDGMLIPDSDSRKLTEDDLKGLDAKELRIARNEIYARHGRKFADKELKEHFEQMEWYSPMIDAGEFDESILNEYELYNLDFIAKHEKAAK